MKVTGSNYEPGDERLGRGSTLEENPLLRRVRFIRSPKSRVVAVLARGVHDPV
jgi:hypothetical protein